MNWLDVLSSQYSHLYFPSVSFSFSVFSVPPPLPPPWIVIPEDSAKIVGMVEHLNLEIQMQRAFPEIPGLAYLVGF